jgi:hypothetical protein
MSDEQTTVVRLPDDEARPRPMPRPFAYPSRFGLGVAVSRLVFEYGRIGAVNTLIEMAEMVERGEDYMTDTVRRRRIVPGVYGSSIT